MTGWIAFREMVSLARRPNKPFEQILVWKYSRFARSREDSIVYKAMLRKNGVQVISINEPFDDTPTGRLLEAIIESLDEFYSDNLGEEVTRGMRESASRGFYLSSKAPYGYRKLRVKDGGKERTKLEVNPDEAPLVTSIFNDISSGKGLTEIAKELNGKGIGGSRGKGWGKTGLYSILSNEIYTGTFIWGRNSKRGFKPIRVEGACPAIVDRETFNRAHNLLRESSLTERRAFIRSFVKEVKVTGDEALLTYTLPLPPEGITKEEDRSSAYRTVWWAVEGLNL